MKYFGRLEKIDLPSMNEEERLKLFAKRRLFEKRNVLSFSVDLKTKLPKENSKTIYEPKKALIEDFYKYLLDIYRENINEECILYLNPFNELTFGLDELEKKKVAREYYKHIAMEIIERGIQGVWFDETKKGTDRVTRVTLIERCEMKQNALKNRVISENRVGFDHYLMGNGSYFTLDLPQRIPTLNELIQFEGGLESILALNEDFSFEEDRFFNVTTAKQTEPLDNENRKLGNKSKKASMPTDLEAKEYLIDTLFRSKG